MTTAQNGSNFIQQPVPTNTQQLFTNQPNQQQQFVQQPQTFVQQQPQQQTIVEQQIPQQQPQYINGQVAMNGQNMSTEQLSEAGQEVFNMIKGANQMLSNGNVQQQQRIPAGVMYQQLPNGQIVAVATPQQQVVPVQQNQETENDEKFFNTWKGKGLLIGGGALVGYGLSKMSSTPNAGDVAALTSGIQTLTESSSSDIIKAFKSFF